MRAPTRSPYLSWRCRAAASRSGTAMETWLSAVIMNKPLNDLRLAQFGDGLVVEAKFAREDFVAVLAERRRWAPHGAGGIRELERNPEHLQGADGGMLDGLDHVARGRLRIVERLGDRVDLPAGNSHRLELGEPCIGVIVRHRLVDHTVDQRPVLDPRAVARKTLILRPFGMTEHFGDARELTFVSDSERNHPIRGLISRIRHDARMPVAEPPGVAPGGEIARGYVDEHRQRRFVERDLDLLALAGAVARVERREDGV